MKKLKTPKVKPKKVVIGVSIARKTAAKNEILEEAKLVSSKGVQSVELPKGFSHLEKAIYWKKTQEGYLLTTRNEFDDLIDFVEKNPPPDSMFEQRPEQPPEQDRKWWYEE